MRFIVLGVCLMTFLAGCGVEWFPGDTVSTSVTITTTTLADAPTGLSYSQTLAATGGTTPYIWTLESGSSLPPGLALSEGGLVTGIPTERSPVPATTPLYTFTVKVADSATTPATTTKILSISTPITVKDSTGKVFAQVLSFDASRGVIVTVTNNDSVVRTAQVVVADYDTSTGVEINGSAFNMTPLSVAAAGSGTVVTLPPTASTVNNWRVKSVTIVI